MYPGTVCKIRLGVGGQTLHNAGKQRRCPIAVPVAAVPHGTAILGGHPHKPVTRTQVVGTGFAGHPDILTGGILSGTAPLDHTLQQSIHDASGSGIDHLPGRGGTCVHGGAGSILNGGDCVGLGIHTIVGKDLIIARHIHRGYADKQRTQGNVADDLILVGILHPLSLGGQVDVNALLHKIQRPGHPILVQTMDRNRIERVADAVP